MEEKNMDEYVKELNKLLHEQALEEYYGDEEIDWFDN